MSVRVVSLDRGAVGVVRRPRPARAPGEALIAPRFVGLCGTDLELLRGTMPYLATGDAAFPLQPGHEIAGVVVEAADERLAVGTAVVVDPVVPCGRCAACRAGSPATRCPERAEVGVRRGRAGGAAELVSVPTANLHALPATVALRDAPLVEPGVTVLNAIRRLGEVAGTRALVIRGGTLGGIAVQLLHARGAEVTLIGGPDAHPDFLDALPCRAVAEATPASHDRVVEVAGAR